MRYILLAVMALSLAACNCGPTAYGSSVNMSNPANGVNAANDCNPCNQPNPANAANQQNYGVLIDDPCQPYSAPAPCPPAAIYSAPCDPAPVMMQSPPCPAPLAAAPVLPPSCEVLMGAAAVNACGQLPAEAKPGETWCCVKIQPPAAAPYEVCTKEACQVAHPTPPVYETRQRQVLCTPARTEWQQISCEGDKSLGQGETLGECWSLVTIPATYKTECYEECVQPAGVRYEAIPAEYRTVQPPLPAPRYEWRRMDGCN